HERQRIFLVRPAAATAPDGDRKLTAREYRNPLSFGEPLASERGVLLSDLAGLTLERVAQELDPVTVGAGNLRSSLKRGLGCRNQPVLGVGEHIRAGLRRFI